MKATERTLKQLLHSGDQYVVPVFQRHYTWERKNWDKLWDDIEALLSPDQEGRHHFLGAIVCVPERHEPGSVASYQIIDGQQRLTTLSLLLCALRDLAREWGFDLLHDETNESYLIHKFRSGRERYKVFPRLRDRDIFQKIVDRERQEAADSQVLAAYSYFRDKLDEAASNGEQALRNVLNTVTDRLDVVSITLDGENPFKIFKSLNSTGTDLGQQDLIRNHVFMGLPLTTQDEFDEREWRPLERYFEKDGQLQGEGLAEFFRDVFMRNGTYVREDDVSEVFEREWSSSSLTPVQLVTQFRSLLKLYGMIEGRTPHPHVGVHEALASLRSLEASTAYPLVLRLMEQAQANQITSDDLAYAVNCIASFILRRYICSEPSRSYGKWFCAACKDLNDFGLPGLLKALHFRGWPDDDRFQEAFLRFPLYDNRVIRRVVLVGLESALQVPTERVALDQCSIEHVMPQTIENDLDGLAWQAELGSDWTRIHSTLLHTPGNLTLVGANYNREMYKKPFSEKRPTLVGSRVYLNRHFSNPRLVSWNEESILERGKEMAALASRVWIYTSPQ